MKTFAWFVAASALAVATAASDAQAQGASSVASRVNAVRDGTVQMMFAPRPGVCGDGNGSVWVQDGGWNRGQLCIVGPVRVNLSRANGQTVTIRKCVACKPRVLASPDVDLGEVNATEAAKYLLDIARQSGTRNSDEAVSAAAFADADNLDADFVRLIRDEDAMLEARRQALFWLGQGDGPTKSLIDLYGGLQPQSLREHFTFVLSQRRDDESVNKLIDIARNDRDSKVRKQAMFWLGQSKDPRAVKFFRDVLSPR